MRDWRDYDLHFILEAAEPSFGGMIVSVVILYE